MIPTSTDDPLALSQSLERVVSAGLRARELAGIRALLQAVSKEIQGFGSVLWEATPDFDYDADIGTFIALTQWFENKAVWREHAVPARSATGFALSINAASYNVTDVDDKRFKSVVYRSPFVAKHDIARVCVVPLILADSARGALDLFRKRSAPPFSDLEVSRLVQMAKLVPDLYETIRDEVAYRLTTEINRILQGASLNFTSPSTYRLGLESLGRKLCDRIAKDLHCVDVSIYLESEANGGRMEAVASTLKTSDESLNRRILLLGVHSDIIKSIREGDTVRIPDLSKEMSVPGTRAGYVEHVEKLLEKKRPDTPLTLIAAPIQAAGTMPFGAIRCCGTYDGPTYFGPREEALLRVISGQIGQFVSDARNRWKLTEENRAWLAISETLDQMRFGDRGGSISSNSVLEESVAAISKGFGDDASVAIKADQNDGDYIGSLISDPRNAIVTTGLQGLQGHTIGTLQVSYPRDSALAGVIQRIANLFGLQISGYYQLASLAESHRRALMSFQHQIRAPLRHAVRRFPMASRSARLGGDPNLHKQIQFLHGITRRAYRIAMTMQLFSRLEAGLPLEPALQNVPAADLQKLLVEAVMDNNAISDITKALEFFVNGSSFDQIGKAQIAVDRNLFDQAVNDVLDNAGKYSFPSTRISVEGRLTKSFLVVSISNTGLRIGTEQVQEVIKKGVRGVLAKTAVAEGEGLGLWIVNEIMKAHGGNLEIIPTTPDPESVTLVNMWFPLLRSK